MIVYLAFLAVLIGLWFSSISSTKVQNTSTNNVPLRKYYPFPLYIGGLFHSVIFSYGIGSLYSKFYPLTYKRSIIQTKDGLSHLNLDTHVINSELKGKNVVIIVLPGIEGTSDDHYIKRFVLNLSEHLNGIPLKQITVVNFRGYGDHSGKKMTSYHNISSIEDIKQAIEYIHSNFCDEHSTVMAVGFSLGANMLAKYLSIVKKNTPITYGVSVSNPFDLFSLGDDIEKHSSFLMRKFYPLYNKRMARGMANKVLEYYIAYSNR
jgi:predicted alpha/beta-fold hydrolase